MYLGDKHLGKCEAVHHGYCAPVLPSRATRPAAPPTGVSKHRTTLRSTKPGKPKLHILRQVWNYSDLCVDWGGGGVDVSGKGIAVYFRCLISEIFK